MASPDGEVTLIDLESGQTKSVPRLPKIQDISLHPTQTVFAVVDANVGTLSIIDLNRSHHKDLGIPELRTSENAQCKPAFIACYFDQTGDVLWTVARLTSETVEVQCRKTDQWSVVGTVTVDDPFEATHCSFHDTSRSDVVALWMAAGQNGQQVFWITKHLHSLRVELEPFLENTSPPVFSPDRDEYLVVDELHSVCKYPFPTDRKLGTCHSKWRKQDFFGDSLCYLDSKTALVLTHHSRVFRIGLRAMKILDEVIIAGHEPKPAEEYYPRLKGDYGICTDISYFTRAGNTVFFVYSRESEGGPRHWKDTLMLYDVGSLVSRPTQRKPDRR